MSSSDHLPQIFSLDEACRLLPQVKHVTADAVREAELLAAQLRGVAEDDPDYTALSAALQEVVESWTAAVESLGGEAKGPWLVDFDNGEGYYCWCYPEPTVAHYHGYDEGFSGRTRIQ
ncbi:MAG TPA: DUF2203 domain-containing protein [Vicinamibacterales bacterium]|nr:DUF2203 domain-containing protein [Vicinamibacterales bacterium]